MEPLDDGLDRGGNRIAGAARRALHRCISFGALAAELRVSQTTEILPESRLHMRSLLGFALLCAAAQAGAQAGRGGNPELQRLQRQVDSLKAVVDSLKRPAKPVTVKIPPGNSTVFSAGRWTIDRSVNKMTDVPSCAGLYRGEWKIQLGKDDLSVRMRGRGGVGTVTLRFDDAPPQEMRLATDMEKDLSLVVVDGNDFALALRSARLRIEIFTILNDIVQEDIDLKGAKQAHDFIVSNPKCRK